MLIVDDELTIVTMTSNAGRWLEELTDGCPGLPDAIRSVVGYVRQLHDSDTPGDRMPRARVRGTSGRWLAIHASRTRETNSESANTAVIIQEAKPAEIAPLIIHAYGLSPREAHVTSLVLHGLSTKKIAAEIRLSPYTVQDHLKAIFAKVGVRSRRELSPRSSTSTTGPDSASAETRPRPTVQPPGSTNPLNPPATLRNHVNEHRGRDAAIAR